MIFLRPTNYRLCLNWVHLRNRLPGLSNRIDDWFDMTWAVTGLRNVEISMLIKMSRTICLLLTVLFHFRFFRRFESLIVKNWNRWTVFICRNELIHVTHMKKGQQEKAGQWSTVAFDSLVIMDLLIRNRWILAANRLVIYSDEQTRVVCLSSSINNGRQEDKLRACRWLDVKSSGVLLALSTTLATVGQSKQQNA